MRAVDWVIKRHEKLLFVEVKDPASSAARRHEDAEKFAKSFQSSDLIPDLVTKFRDTFLYGWARECVVASVRYFVIVTGVEMPLLQAQTDQLLRRVPGGPQKPWHRPLADRCAMFDIASWNREFPDMPLARDA